MQIILDLTEEQANTLSRILWGQGYESSASALRDIIDPAIADAKSREVTAAPRIPKKYVLNCEPGVILGEGAALGEKPKE